MFFAPVLPLRDARPGTLTLSTAAALPVMAEPEASGFRIFVDSGTVAALHVHAQIAPSTARGILAFSETE